MIAGYRAVIDPAAVGRGLEVILDVEIGATDLATVADFEATVASYDEVVELRRMFGRPDYFLRIAVAPRGLRPLPDQQADRPARGAAHDVPPHHEEDQD